MAEVTELLVAAQGGDKAAESELFALIHTELRALARRHLNSGMPRLLQTTSLISETYLRLATAAGLPYRDRGHLFAVASRAMRQIMVDHARAALTMKRGGDLAPVTMDDLIAGEDMREHPQLVIALDQALEKLALSNPRMAKLVDLRFFGGFDLEEIALMLDVTSRTLKRDWRVARVFLYEALSHEQH